MTKKGKNAESASATKSVKHGIENEHAPANAAKMAADASPELDNLRGKILEVKFVYQLENAAARMRGATSGWPFQGWPGERPRIDQLPSLAELVSHCRDRCRLGAIDGAQILGIAASLSTSAHGCFVDQLREATPDLVGLLENPSRDSRIAGVSALSAFRHEAPLSVVERVASLIEDVCPDVQHEAIQALSRFDLDKATIAIPRLASIVSVAKDADVLTAACTTLAWLGTQARTAIAPLVRVTVSCPGDDVVIAATNAITQIDPAGDLVVQHPDLADADARGRFLNCLREIGEKGRALRQRLELLATPLSQENVNPLHDKVTTNVVPTAVAHAGGDPGDHTSTSKLASSVPQERYIPPRCEKCGKKTVVRNTEPRGESIKRTLKCNACNHIKKIVSRKTGELP